MTMRKTILVGLMICLAAWTISSVDAKSWTLAGEKQFSEGELDGISVLSSGEMILAPATEQIPGLEANYVWDVERGPDGRIIIGTGAPAAIYRLNGTDLERVHQTSEEHVLSVLGRDDGSLLAATAPRGMIYRIDKEGDVTIFADLDVQYVWDMAVGPDETIYCATGPQGRLLRLSAEGEPSELHRIAEGNFMCLAVDQTRGDVYAGTEPSGVIYRVTSGGKASVVYDCEESEVHALLRSGTGELYAATAQADGTAVTPARQPSANPQSAAPQAPAAGRGGGNQGARAAGASNSVYRIVPDEGGMRIARLEKALGLSLALSGEGELFVGSGNDGRVVGVNDRGVTRVVASVRAQQVSAMINDGKGHLILATSNGGALWRLKPGYRETAQYTSKAFDASYLSRWSRISAQGNLPDKASVDVRLRVGNTRQPDETWSDWSEGLEQMGEWPVDLPAGRFAQLKVVLATTAENVTPEVLKLAVSYKQANRRPRIQKFMVDGQQSGGNGQKKRPAQQSGGQGRPPRKPARTIMWQAADPNGDQLTFDLYYRGLAEKDWKVIEMGITGKARMQWDTRRVPDGDYMLRLVADDRHARSEGERLAAEAVTVPFVIDNGRPGLIDLQREARTEAGGYVITGTATDDISAISGIEVSRNAGDWVPVFAADGLFDASEEEFRFETDVLEPGEHVFVFAVTDEQLNVGSGKIIIQVPETADDNR